MVLFVLSYNLKVEIQVRKIIDFPDSFDNEVSERMIQVLKEAHIEESFSEKYSGCLINQNERHTGEGLYYFELSGEVYLLVGFAKKQFTSFSVISKHHLQALANRDANDNIN